MVGEFAPDVNEQGPIFKQIMLGAVPIREKVIFSQKALSPELVRDRQRNMIYGRPGRTR